jgi:hypothetical protein
VTPEEIAALVAAVEAARSSSFPDWNGVISGAIGGLIGGVVGVVGALVAARIQANATLQAMRGQLRSTRAAEDRTDRRNRIGPFVAHTGRVITMYAQLVVAMRRNADDLMRVLADAITEEKARTDDQAPLDVDDDDLRRLVDRFIDRSGELYWWVVPEALRGAAVDPAEVEEYVQEFRHLHAQLSAVASRWVEGHSGPGIVRPGPDEPDRGSG